MAEEDMRRWSLRNAEGEVISNNIPTQLLIQWANQGVVQPGYFISANGETWSPVETLPDLEMTWYIRSLAHLPYGPITRAAAERLLAQGRFAPDAEITQTPGEEPILTELPVVDESLLQQKDYELDDLRKRLAMMEKELRAKDRRLEDLQAALTASAQSELNVDGRPDVESLTAELDAAQAKSRELVASHRQAMLHAEQQQAELNQRIQTLETALAAKSAASENTLSAARPDDVIYAILEKEAEVLRKAQEEEEDFLERLREMAKTRMLYFSERLREIRKLMGDSPEHMRDSALRNNRLATLALRNVPNERAYELEKSLADSMSRETELRQRLATLETREHELRTQIAQAEEQTLNAVQLNEKLREATAAFNHECQARATEHQEYMHIQEQLLHRIEELERALAKEPSQTEATSAHSLSRSSGFGWLRQK